MPAPVRKQAISLRVGASDLRRVRHLAERMGSPESEIIRFAIKLMLAKFAPLCDPQIRGQRLLPMLRQQDADELLRHFDLDSTRLEEIVNAGVEQHSQVDMEDIQSIAMHGIEPPMQSLPASVQPSVRFVVANRNAVVALRPEQDK